MFAMDKTKTQGNEIPSPDARDANRLLPSQSRTKKWPVLDASGAPVINLERLPISWNWHQFHCVTRWFLEKDRAGFWERNGYHNHGFPWNEERYGW